MDIRACANNLLKSYLNDMIQMSVNIFYNIVSTGVSQGTVLVFFILYINDLLSSMPEDTIISFVDDTAVISKDKTWTEVGVKMNN